MSPKKAQAKKGAGRPTVSEEGAGARFYTYLFPADQLVLEEIKRKHGIKKNGEALRAALRMAASVEPAGLGAVADRLHALEAKAQQRLLLIERFRNLLGEYVSKRQASLEEMQAILEEYVSE